MDKVTITSFSNLQTIAKSLRCDLCLDSLMDNYERVDDAARYKRSEDAYDTILALISVLEELYKYRPLPF